MSYVKRTSANEFTVFGQKNHTKLGTYSSLFEARRRQQQLMQRGTKANKSGIIKSI